MHPLDVMKQTRYKKDVVNRGHIFQKCVITKGTDVFVVLIVRLSTETCVLFDGKSLVEW